MADVTSMAERSAGRGRLRAAAPAPVSEAPPDALAAPELYLNRELSWLAFNERVLHEAEDERTPLLERIKFLAISASNLDEFFMKRIGGLKQQVVAGLQERTVDGRTPQEQIAAAYAVVRDFERRQRLLWNDLRQRLSDEHGIQIQSHAELDGDEQAALRERYVRNIFPLVTPLALDPAHPFPFISNLSINLLVGGHHPKESEPLLIRVKAPVGSGIPRFVPVGDSRRFVPLEDIIAQNLDLLLPGMAVASCELFRVTRNANTERDEEEADDLLAMIESELRDRRFAPMVRLEVAAGIQPGHRGMLAAELGLDEHADVADVDGLLALRDLMEIAQLDDATLHDSPHHPIDHPRLAPSRNIFHVIRDAGALILQHPYESFSTSVERFVREASEDPKVRAIKMTLYRTSADSNIIEYLRVAARNGKQVAVVIELKARFDEAANIRFATQLEEDGIHVTYGVVGLKTHCKVILVVRQDYNGLRRYVHIGTGNYHAGTARVYADYGLLSSDEALGQDLTELFNYLTTGYRPKRAYSKILPAPTLLKDALLAKIARECERCAEGQKGLIQMKVNALEDADVARALYRASQAGVQVDLVVRDSCRLRPGIEGISERVRVVSIVGRFLEHGRIYYFRNGGAEEYYIGSADCMKRNLESRVEVVAPVEDPDLRAELRAVLDLQLAPSSDAWEMQSDGTYKRLAPDAESCQSAQIVLAEKRQKEAGRLRKRRPKGFARRSGSIPDPHK